VARRPGIGASGGSARLTWVRRACVAALGALAVALVAELAYRAVLHSNARRHGGAEFEVYGVGESTMVGEPFHPKISVPRLLEHVFGGVMAGRPIKVVNLAERGAPLYAQSVAFARALGARNPAAPGVVLVMSGHNESFAPGGEGGGWRVATAIGERSVLVRDVLLALRRRRLIERERSPAASERYLRRVVETALSSGLVPVLTTMASNISRIEPNVDASTAAPIAAIVAQGLALEAHARFVEARDLYRSRLDDTPSAAVLEYRLGRCAEAAGDYAAAREHYWNAVDRDPRLMFGRATRDQNRLVRELAREYRVPLVDAVQVFEEHSPHGILGDDLFMDGQHPTVAGYVLLANAYAAMLSERFATPITRPLRDGQGAAAALGFGPGDEPQAAVIAGSWLIATSVGHPFPQDRMALAEKRFAAAVGKGDDFSLYFGMALAQAAARGGLLRNPDDVRALGGWLGYLPAYSVPASQLPTILARFQTYGVDGDVIARLSAAGTDAAARQSP
jgi:tetratricopeptide (TPR) repeat protein